MNIEQFHKIIRPVERPTRTWHCGFSYLETWLDCESKDNKHGLELSPDFQRGHVWSEKQQIHYVENILRRIVDESGLTIRFNCPAWRNDRSKDSDLLEQMVCIDGLQRLTAIRRFIAGDIKVFGLGFDVLPRRIILRDLQIVVKVYDFQFRKDLLQFYLDINGGGTAHTKTELDRVENLLLESSKEIEANKKLEGL